MPASGLPLLVVKLGGSLMTSPGLDPLLALLARPHPARLVLVPGGGPFADAVRQTQALLAFDDALAHRLALDAMSHVGEILAARQAAFTLVADEAAIGEAHGRGRVPVWHPAGLRAGHPDIPESWTITSDSLAAWLAARLGADRLVLCKSVDVAAPGDRSGWEALAAAGIVDDAFPGFAARYGGPIRIAGPSRQAAAGPLLGLDAAEDDAA
ncbi:amino acid kinase family protein [Labrys wisconsinensis]|uniref:Aspartokinase-like uncharacterized kinase n=1 Tax=Labrys wisconsinensis TaxID=425677 RepID=A0ABU0IYI8_9HYPH|nr:uridylate kinase [Labrys wisconsinensis]MDQ0467080.1 aspartokinase-like uncharacterized kinase [Labrys wisconsinensis]